MNEGNPKQQSTSLLEALYLIRAKNKGEISFAECLKYLSQWAEAVIAEHEAGQLDATPSLPPMQSEGADEGECQSCQ